MYNIGAKVMHPTMGACIIQTIMKMSVEGHRKDYYKLCPILSNRAIVYIPLQSDKSSRIRPIISLEDLQTIGLESELVDYTWIGDNKQRLKMMAAAIKATDFLEEILLIKMLKKRRAEKPLSHLDRESLREAQELVCSELAMIVDRSYDEVFSQMECELNINHMLS